MGVHYHASYNQIVIIIMCGSNVGYIIAMQKAREAIALFMEAHVADSLLISPRECSLVE